MERTKDFYWKDKDFCRTLMLRMMVVNKFEETAFWLFGQGLVHESRPRASARRRP